MLQLKYFYLVKLRKIRTVKPDRKLRSRFLPILKSIRALRSVVRLDAI